MASNPESSAPRVQWGKTLVAAIAVELVLIAITMLIVNSAANSRQTLNWVIPPAALLLFIPAGMWVARGTSAPVLNGFVAGVWGILLYVALTLIMRGAVADFDFMSSVRPAYLLAHGLKVVGGVIGGWLAAKRA